MTMKSADQICLELITGYIRDKQEIAKALGTDPIHHDMMREAETLTRENVNLRKSLESALLRCNHGHDEDQDHCLCWQCEDDRKALNL